MSPMTPEEFLAKMKEFADGNDAEIDHMNADGLLCKTLTSHVYGEGIKIFKDMLKWYS